MAPEVAILWREPGSVRWRPFCAALGLPEDWPRAPGCDGPRTTERKFGSCEPVPRDEAQAAELVGEAIAAIPGDPARAEGLLREALAAALFHAKAHSNLGVLMLGKGGLYGAAHELEWARTLRPGHPEPRLNLALTLERAWQVREAEASYRDALEVCPWYMPAQLGAARLAVAEERRGEELPSWLDAIAIGGDNGAWRRWARARAAELPSAR